MMQHVIEARACPALMDPRGRSNQRAWLADLVERRVQGDSRQPVEDHLRCPCMLAWAALPPEEAIINQRMRVVLTGLTGGACYLRAIQGGRWWRLTVTHGHSGHSDLRPLLYR